MEFRLSAICGLVLSFVISKAIAATTITYQAVPADGNSVWLEPAAGTATTPVPQEVAAQIDAEVQSAYARFEAQAKANSEGKGDADDDEGISKGDFHIQAYKLATPIGPELYAFQIDGPFGWSMGYLTLRAKDGVHLTKAPPAVWLKWFIGFRRQGSDLLESPYIRFEDVDGDGRPELMVETYAHNGTFYNASEYHYFKIDDNLSLSPLFVVEHRTLVPVEIAGFDEPYLERTVTREGPGHLTVNVVLKDESDPKKMESIGSFQIAPKSPNERYQIVSQQMVSKLLPKDVLVTAAEQDANDYLANGDTFFY